MRFCPTNLAVALSVPSCVAQTASPSAPTASLAARTAQPEVLGADVVLQRGVRLEAIRGGQVQPVVLRDKFLFVEDYGLSSMDWRLSGDGAHLLFCAVPRGVDFFSAAAYRSYFFQAPRNGRQRVFLSAYGPHKALSDYAFSAPSFARAGRKVVVTEDNKGNFPEPSAIAIYDFTTRKRLWNSRPLEKTLPQYFQGKDKRRIYESFGGALSDDGSNLVCLAHAYSDGYSSQLPIGQKGPPTLLVHFDLKNRRAQVLDSFPDEAWFGRYQVKGNTTFATPGRPLVPQFAWQPNTTRFAYVRPAPEDNANLELFSFDLKTRVSKRLTHDDADDVSPSWTPDGQSLLWIRGRETDQSKRQDLKQSHIFLADADGKNARVAFPNVQGALRLQVVKKLPRWETHRHLAIETKVGKGG